MHPSGPKFPSGHGRDSDRDKHGLFQRDRLLARSVEEELVDAAEIYARASNLLALARPARVADGAVTTRVGGIFLLGLHGQQFDGATALAVQYDENIPLVAPPRGL